MCARRNATSVRGLPHGAHQSAMALSPVLRIALPMVAYPVRGVGRTVPLRLLLDLLREQTMPLEHRLDQLDGTFVRAPLLIGSRIP